MPSDATDPELREIARRVGAELGPFRRRLMNASRRAADLPDLPDAQVEVLRRLEATGWATPTGLGRVLGLARSTVSNLVLAMERDGLVDRRLAKGDGRSTEVGLTDRARGLLRTFGRAAGDRPGAPGARGAARGHRRRAPGAVGGGCGGGRPGRILRTVRTACAVCAGCADAPPTGELIPARRRVVVR